MAFTMPPPVSPNDFTMLSANLWPRKRGSSSAMHSAGYVAAVYEPFFVCSTFVWHKIQSGNHLADGEPTCIAVSLTCVLTPLVLVLLCSALSVIANSSDKLPPTAMLRSSHNNYEYSTKNVQFHIMSALEESGCD
jgi:hypothetical protein